MPNQRTHIFYWNVFSKIYAKIILLYPKIVNFHLGLSGLIYRCIGIYTFVCIDLYACMYMYTWENHLKEYMKCNLENLYKN